jgi:hypothetical protein
MADDSPRQSDSAKVGCDVPLLLRTGAVAVLDALGFKGIWETVAPGQVIQTLRRARDVARRDTALHNLFLTGGRKEAAIEVRFFSDTIVVIGTVPDNNSTAKMPEITLGDVVAVVATAVMYIITEAVLRNPPLAYRGCIAAGPILAKDEFFVGAAVDEAAEWANKAEAAVVWLRPSAREALAGGRNAAGEPPLFAWEVPLKSSELPTPALVVSPLALGGIEGSEMPWAVAPIDELSSKFMRTFECARVDVTVKRENTKRALEAAASCLRLDQKLRGRPMIPPSRDPEQMRALLTFSTGEKE